MTPAARIQAAIEMLDMVLEGAAVEKALTNWARRSRFAGSKDRRAVRDHVYQALRCRRSFAALGGGLTGRALMIGAVRAAGADPADIFTGQGHAPPALSTVEARLPDPGADPQADWNLPDWMIPLFQSALRDQAYPTAQALAERAPVTLRVNLRKIEVAQAIQVLADEGIRVVQDAIAATALRVVEGAPRIQNSAAYRDGLVELQDGSSQAAMSTLNIPKGAKVLDYCAGGGGKTLALAARADANWFAHDALPQRMKDTPDRAARADVAITLLDDAGIGAEAPFDIVLCDVPCSGSGTWRRTPQAKWDLKPERLTELRTTQARILEQAVQYVDRDGKVIYATCSVFEGENEEQIARFIADHSGWICDNTQHWPVSASGDGFFVAHLSRVKA